MREKLEAFLREAREAGKDAWATLEEAKRHLLKVPLPPTRYEAKGDVYGRARLVAVLEREGEEVDRVAIRSEAVGYEGLLEAVEDLEKLAEKLNSLPPEERPPVPFYPWSEEETGEILEVLERYMWLDLEDFLGHPLGAYIAVAWKEEEE